MKLGVVHKGRPIEMDHAVLAAYAEHTGDNNWLNIEVPTFTTPQGELK